MDSIELNGGDIWTNIEYIYFILRHATQNIFHDNIILIIKYK